MKRKKPEWILTEYDPLEYKKTMVEMFLNNNYLNIIFCGYSSDIKFHEARALYRHYGTLFVDTLKVRDVLVIIYKELLTQEQKLKKLKLIE